MTHLARALLEELGPDELAELASRLAPYMPRREAADGWLATREAAAYLGISRHALHRLTAERRIPFTQDTPGGRCYFRRSDLETWRAAAA